MYIYVYIYIYIYIYTYTSHSPSSTLFNIDLRAWRCCCFFTSAKLSSLWWVVDAQDVEAFWGVEVQGLHCLGFLASN